MKTSDPNLLLMDRVHGWTFSDKEPFQGVLVSPATRAVQAKLRLKLRDAQRYVLDDDAVRLICNLSLETGRLPGWSILARLPYDTIWIEYDVRVKIAELDRLDRLNKGLPDLPVPETTRLGYLLYREEPEGDRQRWICHVYGQQGRETTPGIITFLFDPEGDASFPVRGSSVWKSTTLSLRGDAFRPLREISPRDGAKPVRVTRCDPECLLAGLPIADMGSILAVTPPPEGDDATLELRAPDWLVPRMAAIVDPWWEAHCKSLGFSEAQVAKMVNAEIMENAGHLRWIITMLAAIGGLPRGVRAMKPRPGKHAMGMYQMPFLGHSNLTLTIPKGDAVLRARTLLDREAKTLRKRRRGPVEGHWRVVEFNRLTYMCRHLPTELLEPGLARCERCGLKVRWIKWHERGDATLGYVDHNKYTVTT